MTDDDEGAPWGEQLVTTVEAAQLARRSAATVRSWVHRGLLQPADVSGRERLYRVRDVLQVERATRRSARQAASRFRLRPVQH